MNPLDKANDFLQNSGKYFEWEKLKLVHDLKSQVEELQKALEEIYIHTRTTELSKLNWIAKKALGRSEPK